jgi:predicted ester cyclase
MDPIAVVRQYVDALNHHDWRAVESLLHPTFRRYSAAAGESGEESADEFLTFLRNEHETFPDAREELLDIFACGSKVAARHLFTGTQRGSLGRFPPTGHRLQSVYLALYEIADGLIGRSWAEWDNLSDLRRLGLASDFA